MTISPAAGLIITLLTAANGALAGYLLWWVRHGSDFDNGYAAGLSALRGGTMREIKRDAAELAAADQRRAELGKLKRAELAALHRGHHPTSAINYDAWDKELLVRAVLEDEGHIWHPEPE